MQTRAEITKGLDERLSIFLVELEYRRAGLAEGVVDCEQVLLNFSGLRLSTVPLPPVFQSVEASEQIKNTLASL